MRKPTIDLIEGARDEDMSALRHSLLVKSLIQVDKKVHLTSSKATLYKNVTNQNRENQLVSRDF